MKTGKYTGMSNEQLVALYKETKSEEVFNVLHQNVKGLIYKAALKYKGTPGYDVDDLVIEGCIDLLKAIENFNPDKGVAFTTFLYKELNCFFIDLLRVAGAEKRCDDDTQSMDELMHGAGEDDFSDRGNVLFSVECESYGYFELLDVIEHLKLSKQERVTVNLLIDGWSKKDIADQLNIKSPAVHCYLNRVGKKLAFSLQTA